MTTGDDDLKVVWYAGDSKGNVVVIQNLKEEPLPHHVKHSPTGFAWGYLGSGPADLARSMLIHALGARVVCGVCGGTAQVVYDPANDEPISVREAEDRVEGSEWVNAVFTCTECEDGVVVVPAMYQQFKEDVVAKMTPGQPWSMPQSEVLDWWRRNQEVAR